jgi:hypothetical protein
MDDKTVLSSIKRRPARVEEFLPLPITIERFYAGVHRRARRKGESFCSAMRDVLKEVGDSELDFLAAELALRLNSRWIAAGAEVELQLVGDRGDLRHKLRSPFIPRVEPISYPHGAPTSKSAKSS